MKLKSICSFVAALTLALATTACSASPSVSKDPSSVNDTPVSSSNAQPSAEYPIVIKHAFGETVIESKPERVAAISWGNPDLPLALGVLPVGLSEANYGVTDSRLLPWTTDRLAELSSTEPVLFRDSDGLDFEAVSDVSPDIILAAYSGITQEEYDLLSEIAPVVAYPTLPWQTYWREQITLNATGLGLQAEGQQLVTDLETMIEDKVSQYPEIKGKTAAFIYFIPTDFSQFYVYLPVDPRAAYLTDLGMVFPQSLMDHAGENPSFSITLSAENVDLLSELDMIIAYGDDSLLQAIKADALLGTIPAVKRESVVFIQDNSPLAASATPSALSIPATIDEYLALISEAAQKVK